jgi:NAD-dependent DNA ligase
MIKFPKHFSIVDRINFLQRKVILNSIMYYEYDKSFISDSYFDEMSRQLVQMQKDYDSIDGQSIKKDTKYGYMMFDFDGSTGFDLYSKLNVKDDEELTLMCGYKLYREKEREKQK